MKKKAGKVKTLAHRRARVGMLFCAPFIAGFIMFYLSPLIRTIVYSFHAMSGGIEGYQAVFTGWSNYVTVLTEKIDFRDAVFKTMSGLLQECLPIVLFSFFLAIVLNQNFRGRGFFRVIFFLPVIIYSGAMASRMADSFLTNIDEQIVGAQMHDGALTINLVDSIMNMLPIQSTGIETFVEACVGSISNIITGSSIQIVIYLAGLQTISASLYEAADIEGAPAWVKFWKITMPMMSPYVLVNILYTVIDALCGTKNAVISYIIENMETYMGESAAASVLYILIVLVIIGVVYKVVDKMVYYEN